MDKDCLCQDLSGDKLTSFITNTQYKLKLSYIKQALMAKKISETQKEYGSICLRIYPTQILLRMLTDCRYPKVWHINGYDPKLFNIWFSLNTAFQEI